MSRKLTLINGPPWGFRIAGGADIDQNLVVSRVSFVFFLHLILRMRYFLFEISVQKNGKFFFCIE